MPYSLSLSNELRLYPHPTLIFEGNVAMLGQEDWVAGTNDCTEALQRYLGGMMLMCLPSEAIALTFDALVDTWKLYTHPAPVETSIALTHLPLHAMVLNMDESARLEECMINPGEATEAAHEGAALLRKLYK